MCAWIILQNRSHIRPQTSLNKFKKIEIISGIFSDYNGMKPEIDYRKETGKNTNTRIGNNVLLKNQWLKGEIKREIKNYLETNGNEETTFQNVWDAAKGSSKRGVHSCTALPQETNTLKIPNKQSNFTPKELD